MEVLIIALIVVVVILFTATLSMVKQFGFIKCLFAMIVSVCVALLAVYIVNTVIVYILIKMLIMWLVIS